MRKRLREFTRTVALPTMWAGSLKEKWLTNYDQFRDGALEAPDFSATTDLYQVVANVHAMKLVPFELRAVVILIAAALLPFVPVVLLMMPIKLIVTELARLLV